MKEFFPFRLDTLNQCLWRLGEGVEPKQLRLTPKAFAVLRYLVEHPRRLVTQDELLDAVWRDSHVQPEVLKSQILDIRRALGDDPKSPRFIETMPRRGYNFIASVREDSDNQHFADERPSKKLVGRTSALAALCHSLGKAELRQRQLLFISGEAGIGKTALVDEFERSAFAGKPNLRFACGQCVEGYSGKEPYHPMLEALGHLCRGAGGALVIDTLVAQAPTWLVQFPALVKRERREMLQREILGATRERMLREISEALETIASESLLLLVFEDLHWVDHATVDLISALARRREPAKLMLIGTYRPVDVAFSDNPLKALKPDLLIHRLCREIALEPLGEAEVAEYLTAESGGAAVPEGLAGLIYRHSEGNPLFMVAALEEMKQRNVLKQEARGLVLTRPIEAVDISAPDSLRQMIAVQIDRLSQDERRALEVASVTGTTFASAISATAAEMDSEIFESVCEALVRKHHVLRRADPQDFPNGLLSGRYEFVHGLYREMLYQDQSQGRRAKLHLSIGTRLEQLFSGHESDVAAELTEHFEQGFDWPRTVKYQQLAADTASRRFEPRQAAEILEHALEIVKKLPELERAKYEIEVLEKLSTIYVASGDPSVEETFGALVSRAAHYDLVEVQVRALMAWAFFVAWMSSDRCLELLKQAFLLCDSQPDALVRARTRARCCALSLWATGWNRQTVDEFRQSFEEVLETAPRNTLAPYLVDFGFVMWISSEYVRAGQALIKSRAIVFQNIAENPYLDTAYLLGQCVLCLNLLFMGEWGNALREIEDTITLVDKNSQSIWGQALRLYKAWVHLHAQDFVGTLAMCDSALPLLQDPEPRPHPDHPAPYPFEFWMCLVLRGVAETSLGNHESALRHLTIAEADMKQQVIMLGWYWHMPLELAFAEVRLAKGDLPQARAHAEKLLNTALANAEHSWQALAWEINSRVAITQGDPHKAEEFIARAVSSMEGFSVPLAAWRVHATASEVYQNSGDLDLAERHRALSRDTIMELANSLPADEPLQQIFLSAPMVRKIIGHSENTRETRQGA